MSSFSEDNYNYYPNHPKTLTTLEDYENAPLRTIVARPYHAPEIKTSWDSWVSVETSKRTNSEMARVPREVLRYGWGESDLPASPHGPVP